MNKSDAIAKLNICINELRKVKATNFLGATYLKWQRDTIVTLSHIFGNKKNTDGEFKQLLDTVNYRIHSTDYPEKEYHEGLEKAESFIESCIREIDEYWIDENSSNEKTEVDSMQIIERLCSKFHVVSKQLKCRREERNTLEIRDEYDVQDLFHALLRIFFDDIRPEEWTPSYAGKSSRMDFLIKDHAIVIETKMARKGLNSKEIGSQLLEDIARYNEHQDCKSLICFVYDPESIILNPVGLENDLNRFKSDMNLKVLILPK